jgi:NADPH-dependent 2,4-dienoyl-CoA reductase/sulfur reductase-like enzyme
VELASKDRALRPIFDKYAGEDWKAPLDVVVPTIQEANLLAEAIAFFHGTEAEISQIDVAVPISKDALVHVPQKAYRVVSEGYMG